jgi:MoxR-like ATPase
MNTYPFKLVNYNRDGALADQTPLLNRPFTDVGNTFAEDARRFVPGEQLEIAINTAIAVGEPLLITGEPGTGKTQTAYYAAYKLGIEPVLHFQVKSETTARDLLYHFDTVRYFHDAHFSEALKLDKRTYVEEGMLWNAFTSETPRILLIDEIDKAPRDFPNDLLHELDKMEFTVPELRADNVDFKVDAPKEKRPIVFITSNSERRLPEPFLRRCVYHHIRFDDELVRKAVENRKSEYENLSEDFIELAIRRFLALRDRPLRKLPATSELLVWLRVLALAVGTSEDQLKRRLQPNENLSRLPYLGTLLKDHQDIEELGTK